MRGQASNEFGTEKENDMLEAWKCPPTTSSSWLWMAFSSVGVNKADSALINFAILNIEMLKYQNLVILHLEG